MTVYALGPKMPVFPPTGDYWIAPDSNIIGQVIIGEAVSVWFGSTLRGDNEPIEVGWGTNIQENCVLHTDMGYPLSIGKNCTVGHKAMLHGCTIGELSLIGMGATLLNGSSVGRNCIVGAGAMLTEGKSVPDGTLALGSPAKVIRALTNEEIERLAWTAEHYRANMRRMKRELEAIG
ncbi:MAG: gamma carbonic anhydrase family protein [Albidovulum sp.]|nr:gamma carbonic anhydrase family protein [Albidovulum sp.]